MKIISQKDREAIVKLQTTLIAINQNRSVFFNITQFEKMGLIRSFGKTIDNCTHWILTEKGKQMAYAIF